jgi:hypothetical protein
LREIAPEIEQVVVRVDALIKTARGVMGTARSQAGGKPFS